MICYYLKGKNGEYIARDPTGRIKLVSDLADALLVPEVEKKKIKAIQANNIPDVLKKFGPYEICETDYNGVEASAGGRRKRVKNEITGEWENDIE